MELGLKDGKLVWLKADGTTSKTPVKKNTAFFFCKFSWKRGDIVEILEGDPVTDEIVLVKAYSSSWVGPLILSKRTREGVEIHETDIDFARTLVSNPPKPDYSLESIFEVRKRAREEELQKKRDAVDMNKLMNERGLAVWPAKSFHGYWCKEHGEFNGIPEDWTILTKGDSALTRRVCKGPHWILLIRRKKNEYNDHYTERIATIAPSKNIEVAFNELGGEEGAISRREGKEEGQRKREEGMTENLRSAIKKLFPNIPEKDINDVLNRCRQRGAVGTAQWLYFRMAKSSDESYDQAAYLAVRAHVRHQYTGYDDLLSQMNNEEMGYWDNARGEARSFVAGDIEEVLSSWR